MPDEKKYQIILADPPWHFNTWGQRKRTDSRAAAAHYKTMDISAICDLSVQELSAKDCTLFLWATWPNLPDALEVIKAWGFTYKTVAFVWVKQNASGWGTRMGLGYWTRANTEMCLLATRGNPRRVNNAVRQIVFAPIRQHSRKPDEVYEKIVDLMGDLPRVELFARRAYPGWDAIGNEIDGRDIRDVLAEAS